MQRVASSAGRCRTIGVVILSDLDLHLFNEGTHRRLWECLGAQPLPEGGVRFAVWAPNASAVYVLGDWNGWGEGLQLQPQASSGIWAVVCPTAEPGHRYKYSVADAAGYTMVKKNWFNGVNMPAIAIRDLDGTIRPVREFTYDDYRDSLS